MNQPAKPQASQKSKIYFIYFIIFSVFVIVIFAWQLLSNFWNYWAYLSSLENFYKNLAQNKTQISTPTINKFDPIIGNPASKVFVFQYTDYFCPQCAKANQLVQEVAKTYGEQIVLIYKGTPLTVTPEERFSLLATYCASEQNQFIAYQNLLWQDPVNLTQTKYLDYAKQLNLKTEDFQSCLDTQKYLPTITANLNESLNLNINSLPVIYVNMQRLEAKDLDLPTLQRIINQNL